MKEKKNFTLIEVMIAVAVFAIIMTTAGGFFLTVHRSWQRQRSVLDLVQNTRWAMELFSNEVRASTVTATPGLYRVNIQAGGTRIKFGLDTDGDGSGDTQVFYWQGNGASFGDTDKIYRGIGNNINAANSNRQEVANFIVTNPSGNDIFSESGGLITVELTVRPDPSTVAGSANQDFTVVSRVRVRN